MPDLNPYEIQPVMSPGGTQIQFCHRLETTDLSTIAATSELWGFSKNEYGLKGRAPMKGWAIDVGAHIGSVAVALAVDHPRLHVIAIEALAENCDVMRKTIEINRLDNITVLNAAASDQKRKHVAVAYNWHHGDAMEDAYVRHSRFVGGMISDPSGDFAYPPGVGLSQLLKEYAIDRVTFMKIDCEGCEWAFLTSKDIGRVDEIVGEYHFGGRIEGIASLLDKTHDVTFEGGEDTVGNFRAVRR